MVVIAVIFYHHDRRRSDFIATGAETIPRTLSEKQQLKEQKAQVKKAEREAQQRRE